MTWTLQKTTALASHQILRCTTAGAKATCPTLPGCAGAIARWIPTPTASATTSTNALGRSTSAASATVLAPFTSAAARASSPTLWVNAVALARRTKTKMGCATTWTTASGPTMLVASAMDQAKCTIVGALPSQRATATATATSWTRWACAEAVARRMPTATAFATTRTNALVNSTSAGNATDQALCSNAVVTKSKTANATATAMLKTPWGCVEATVPKIWMATAFVTMKMNVSASWTNAANAMARAPSSNAVATKSRKARATAKATSSTFLAIVVVAARPTWTTTAFATTKTTALEPWTPVGFATDQEQCTNAVATTSKKASATV